MATDPYTVLGIDRSASSDEIRAKFRKLARKYHPDLNPGNKESEAKFKELNTAYEILSDADKKAKYDNGEIDASGAPISPMGSAQYSASRGSPYYYETQHDGGRYASAFEGFGADVFEEIFRRQGAYQGSPVAPDQHYLLEIDFRSAALGGEKEMELPSGKAVKVRIPPGVESGKTLRLKGFAGNKTDDMAAGDVYIEITVQPSNLFTRSGKNIELEVPVTFYEAVLGGEIRVPTLEKPIMLKVPPGSNTGTKLKAKGKGIAGAMESDRGDMVVTLKVVMPSSSDAGFRDADQALATAHPYDPRALLEKDGGSR